MKRFWKILCNRSRKDEPPASGQNPITKNSNTLSFNKWIQSQIEAEAYWFHKMELPGGLVTPGWNDPKTEKLPYFGLPDNMTGMRVLDIGHAGGFFSFEAERRGAAEVIFIDNYRPMIHKFNVCSYALRSRARSFLASVYDLNPRAFGTFDLVFFFGVLYHLRNPILALEMINSVCTGSLLIQSATCANDSEVPMAEFHPFGIESGPPEKPSHDPTCFWFPNVACVRAMLEHVGFQEIERVSPEAPMGAIFREKAAVQRKGTPPDETKAPWS